MTLGMYRLTGILLLILGSILACPAQSFLLGADLSYINEMEDCGALYYHQGVEQDPYSIFAENECQLVRLRLWHTPSWYDTLNNGLRYSDLEDVKKSIERSHDHNMSVLLDFHLSDFWADPSRQWIPDAWSAVVDDLSVLQDSLYLYIYATLEELQQEGLMPEMVQIGNETNRGILQSIEDHEAGWSLDWERNSALFNTAIQAVKDIETNFGADLQIALHIAGPAEVGYYADDFISNGVTDFDIIGFSYYWHWHQPSTIEDVAIAIEELRTKHPSYEVMILETGYQWTNMSNDAAGNIISDVYPDHSGVTSPDLQLDWLTELSQTALHAGAMGVIYWEPAWVSTSCYTPWAQGSHYENVTFFDFNNELLENGGMDFFSFPYQMNSIEEPLADPAPHPINIYTEGHSLFIQFSTQPSMNHLTLLITDTLGRQVGNSDFFTAVSVLEYKIPLPSLASGFYYLTLTEQGTPFFTGSFYQSH
jgi:arabinogalactan endo-1,4-beta-galactosidase